MSDKIHYSETGGVAHIGLTKTGSTYLQNHIFPQLFNIYYSTDTNFKWPNNLDYIGKQTDSGLRTCIQMNLF